MFTIDGVEYNVKCSIERTAEIRISDISGMLLNGQIFNDVLGTYYAYDIRLEMPLKNRGRYASLIGQLTEPVEGHAFVLPYNTDTIQITGIVKEPKDVWKKLPSGYTYWDGLQFTIDANHPTFAPDLNQTIARGLTPLPDVAEPTIGDTYTFTADGWVETEGGDVTVVPLSVDANGSYSAPAGQAYSPVTVDVDGVDVVPLSVAANGSYTAPTGQAYSPVTVRVPGSGEPSVPSGYQEVAYLQCTDYQCVTLDINPRGKVISVDVSQDALSSSESGFAGYYENASAVVEMYFKSGAIIIYSQSPSIDKNLIDTAVAGTRYSVAFVFVTNTSAINIGCYRTDRYPFAGKLYRAEVRDDNSGLHMLLKPCYRKSDSEPGFYDVINDAFYTNSGSGAFTVGPDV